MKAKITTLCKEYDMNSKNFISGVIMYAEMLESHSVIDKKIIERCEALIKIKAEKQEPNWDVLTILKQKRKWNFLSIVRKAG